MSFPALLVFSAVSLLSQDVTTRPAESGPDAGWVRVMGRVTLEDGRQLPHPPNIGSTCNAPMSTTWSSFTFNLPAHNAMSGSIRQMLCHVVVSLPGYRTVTAPLVDGMTVVLKKLGENEGSTVSLVALSAPTPARKSFEKAERAIYKKEWEKAKRFLEGAIAIYPQHAAAWYELGGIHERESRKPEAAAAYRQATEADPRFIKPFVALAALAIEDKDWQSALDFSERAIALNPIEFPRAYLLHALACSHLDKPADAERSARKAVELDSANSLPAATFLLAELLFSRNDIANAAALYRRYLELNPSGPNAPTAHARLASLSAPR
jgi:tetratricopeptide (TPR) repeat protein